MLTYRVLKSIGGINQENVFLASGSELSYEYAVIKKSNNTYSYYISISSEELISAQCIVALYNDSRLLNCGIENIEDKISSVLTGEITAAAVPDRYKILLWSELSTVQPICEWVEGNIR